MSKNAAISATSILGKGVPDKPCINFCANWRNSPAACLKTEYKYWLTGFFMNLFPKVPTLHRLSSDNVAIIRAYVK